MSSRNSGRHQVALTIGAIAGLAAFCLMTLVSASLHAAYDPTRQSISALALGPYGWLENLAFYLLGLALITFGFALYFGVGGERATAVLLLFVAMGIGEMTTGTLRSDINARGPMSLHALIHQAGATVSAVAFPVAGLLLAPVFRRQPNWGRGLARYTFVNSVVVLALEAAREVSIPFHWLDPWFGLYEKMLTAISLIWLGIIAARLLRR